MQFYITFIKWMLTADNITYLYFIAFGWLDRWIGFKGTFNTSRLYSNQNRLNFVRNFILQNICNVFILATGCKFVS